MRRAQKKVGEKCRKNGEEFVEMKPCSSCKTIYNCGKEFIGNFTKFDAERTLEGIARSICWREEELS